MLKVMVDGNPQLKAIMSNPEVVNQLMSIGSLLPENLKNPRSFGPDGRNGGLRWNRNNGNRRLQNN
jgi:hypothetical protein